MKKHYWLIALMIAVAALFFVGCADEDEDNPGPTDVPPATPSGLTAAQTVRSQINLSWLNVADEDSFLVQRSFDSSAWSLVTRTAANVLTAVDPGVHANVKQWYRVASKNVAGASAYSAPVSIWTWPGVYDFSADETDNFAAQSPEGPPNYHIWEWDATAQAGKLTIEDVAETWVDLSTLDTLTNQGWFESRVKIAAWAADDTIFYGVLFDVNSPNNIVALKFTQNSSLFYYRDATGTATTIATNPQVPVLTENAFHTIRLFRQGTQWTLYIDGTQIIAGTAPNTAMGNTGMIQEWWYDRGTQTGERSIWVDDVARPGIDPSFIADGGSRAARSLDAARTVKK